MRRRQGCVRTPVALSSLEDPNARNAPPQKGTAFRAFSLAGPSSEKKGGLPFFLFFGAPSNYGLPLILSHLNDGRFPVFFSLLPLRKGGYEPLTNTLNAEPYSIDQESSKQVLIPLRISFFRKPWTQSLTMLIWMVQWGFVFLLGTKTHPAVR
ncbi:hypothetical protein ABB02_01590 [Clostridiaceae bacterium JG1575]|nr:hypothetical protein ABB02_01590 [Clostridiaceae bacterium JG1575]